MGLTESDFWAGLGKSFWETLHWTQDGQGILDAVLYKFHPDDVMLCSSPCRTKGCKEGKVIWVERHLPGFRHLILSNRKEIYSAPGRLLIDDSDANVDKWVAAGGAACLLPRPWNRNHSDRPLAYLKSFLETGEG